LTILGLSIRVSEAKEMLILLTFSGFSSEERGNLESGPRNLRKIDPLILKSDSHNLLEESERGRKVSRLPRG